MNDETITRSSKLYNGVMVKTKIIKRGAYENEYIDDQEYYDYCHWCKMYQNGCIDFNTAMNIIKGDNLQRFYQPVDFEKSVKSEEIKAAENMQKRVESVIETYNRINPKKTLGIGE